MSAERWIAGRTDQISAARGLVRVVKPAYRGRADTEIHAIGLLRGSAGDPVRPTALVAFETDDAPRTGTAPRP